MRLTVEDHDNADPEIRDLAWNCEIYVDGELVPYVVEVDDEAGVVKCYILDCDGHLMVEGESQQLKIQTLHGKVEIRDKRKK